MTNIDKRGRLQETVFTYLTTKDGRVLIKWQSKLIKTLKGDSARKLIAELDQADDHQAQLLLAKVTGNFKHGNEKLASKKED